MIRRYTITVWDKPKPLARPRFARTPTGVRTYLPRKDQDVRFNIRKAWQDQVGKQLLGPLRLEMTAWLPVPGSVPKKRRLTAMPAVRPDLDNYVKQVEDALQGYAYPDDKQIVTIEARKRYCINNQSPCWEISLFEFEEVT